MGRKLDFWEFEIVCDRRHDMNFDSPKRWMKLENNLFHNSKFDAMSVQSQLFYLLIVASGSSIGSKLVRFTQNQIVKMIKCKPKSIPKYVSELTDTQWIRLVKAPSQEVSDLGRSPKKGSKEVSKEMAPSRNSEFELPIESENSRSPVLQSKPVAPKKTELVFSPKNPNEILEQFDPLTLETWSKLYNGDLTFLERETLKAFQWYRTNPKRSPKNVRGWKQALSYWYERSWKQYVRTIPTNKPHQSQTTGIGEF